MTFRRRQFTPGGNINIIVVILIIILILVLIGAI